MTEAQKLKALQDAVTRAINALERGVALSASARNKDTAIKRAYAILVKAENTAGR